MGAAILGIVALGLMVMVSMNAIPASPTQHAARAAVTEPHAACALASEPQADSAALLLAATSAAMTPTPAIAPSPMMRRASFTWTGNSSDPDYWYETSNGSGMGGACTFPCSSTDDATISLCFTVVLDASRTIDDLTINIGDTCIGQIDGDGNERTLTCDTVTIAGENSGIKVIGKAGIVTN